MPRVAEASPRDRSNGAACPSRPATAAGAHPAHDEEVLIDRCLRSLRALGYPADRLRIVVIADNYSDRTAALARSAGAQCLERRAPTLCGKPRAIAWALERQPLREFDAVVILDADTIVDPRFAAALASAGPLADKALQGYNGVSNPDDTAITRMAAVFADAKCRFAYALKQRAGLNIPLRLGGCIGTGILATQGWDAFSNRRGLGALRDAHHAGRPHRGVPDARVYAQEARALGQSASQRQRWTAGRLTVLARCAGPLLRSRRFGFRQKLDTIAELVAPGPVVHLALAAVLVGLALGLRLPGSHALVPLLLAGVVRHVIYAVLALTRQPQPTRAAVAFLYLPWYGLWRLVVELASLRMLGDKPWVRTRRHEPA